MKSEKLQNVALVYVERPDSNTEQDLYELRELISTAQCQIKLECTQKRVSLDPTTVLGSGKLDELKNSLSVFDDIDAVIFSCPLSSTQRATLNKTLDKRIVDKIDLILDIFALRATSAEGKKQVELAQLSYNLATKTEGDFSRQGAGIGTRGPGETKLETNKRLIRDRIVKLKQELKEIESRRNITRKKREENKVFTVALVGYTNAGKSTLFNLLTDSGVYADDKLFATLDTVVRKITFPNGLQAVICDTVGFIKELPTTLLNAFKSTLEEAVRADLLLNVCDVSDENVQNHIDVTEGILAELGASAPIIRVYNKCDKANAPYAAASLCDGNVKSIYVSALTGKNIDALTEMIEEQMMSQYAVLKLKTTLENSAMLLSSLRKYTAVIETDYREDCLLIKSVIPRKYANLFSRYMFFE